MAFWKRKNRYVEVQKGPRVRSTCLPEGGEGRGQKAEGGGQRTEDSRQQAEDRGQPDTRNSKSGTRIAVLGDIHANLEALTTVLTDIKEKGVSQMVCTGDMVGYGADPSACLEMIRELGCPVVMGNHDSYAATEDSLKEFNLNAMNAILWTREHLSVEEKQWLLCLPMEMDLTTQDAKTGNETCHSVNSVLSSAAGGEKITLVHSGLVEPGQWHYILKPEAAESALKVQKQDLVFFGHTHVPSLFSMHSRTGEFRSCFPLKEGVHALDPEWRHLLNPGSVGQPRDRDTRASYAVYDPEAGTIEIRRLVYDIATVQAKIESAGLPLRNAERLRQGR